MTKKDFKIVAEIIAIFGEINDSKKSQINNILSLTNPRFNEIVFWEAVEEYKLKQ